MTVLSRETTQARTMFEVDACYAHIDCAPCQSVMCKEEQGEMLNRALCFAHECHRCASLLFDKAFEEGTQHAVKAASVALGVTSKIR